MATLPGIEFYKSCGFSERGDFELELREGVKLELVPMRKELTQMTRIKTIDGWKTRRKLLNHFLAALAYRTQKALRDAPEDFGSFRAKEGVRTPAELVRHMTSVLGYARTYFIGGRYWPEPLESLDEEIERFHEMIGLLAQHLRDGDPLLEGMY